MQPESAETLLKRYAKRNFWLNVLDGVAFVFGISMVSRYTVLPLFVSRLSSERWLQGLIPALTQAGALLPVLFMAPLTASLPRRKPLILLVTIGERLPWLMLGLILLRRLASPVCWGCTGAYPRQRALVLWCGTNSRS